jgi:hypothetical protein
LSCFCRMEAGRPPSSSGVVSDQCHSRSRFAPP